MVSAIKDSATKNRKKSFRVTFAPGTKTEEEQINNFVRAIECKGPGIDDLSKMIKNLPKKKTPMEKHQDKEAEKISNMIFYLRKTLDSMLEKECNISNTKEIKIESEKRSSNSSIDSAIGDCSKSSDYYNELNSKNEAVSQYDSSYEYENNDSTISSPGTRQKVSDLLKELDSCIEELREDDVCVAEDENCQLLNSQLLNNNSTVCVKDVFATGILIASFVQTFTTVTLLEQQYSILTDDKIYIFDSNRSKSPLKNIFVINKDTKIERSEYIANALVLKGEYNNNCNKKIADKVTLGFSSEEECNIWLKLLLDIMETRFTTAKVYPKRTVSLNTSKIEKKIKENAIESYNPRQTILSALCVLEGIEKSF